MSKYYEIVIFTAGMPDYADWVINGIDKTKNISHRLYRQHTTLHGSNMIKDLSLLGRDLSKTIIIDNMAENFQFKNPLNGIWVESWYNDANDKELTLLIPFLKSIVEQQVDVRSILTDNFKNKVLYKRLYERKEVPEIKGPVNIRKQPK